MTQSNLPTSSFLFLNKKGLTLKADDDAYLKRTRNTYKQQAYKCLYICLLCKLYDSANLPRTSPKAFFYGPIFAVVCTYSFYKASARLADFISDLNLKYDDQYKRYMLGIQ